MENLNINLLRWKESKHNSSQMRTDYLSPLRFRQSKHQKEIDSYNKWTSIMVINKSAIGSMVMLWLIQSLIRWGSPIDTMKDPYLIDKATFYLMGKQIHNKNTTTTTIAIYTLSSSNCLIIAPKVIMLHVLRSLLRGSRGRFSMETNHHLPLLKQNLLLYPI